MTSPALTLTDFLLARIADDAGQARADQADAMVGHRWKHAPQEVYDELQGVVLNWTRRVLAECEAKRAQVEHLIRFMEGDYAPWNEEQLQIMAAVYADHPDYRQEWRP